MSYRILNENITGDEAVINVEHHYADGSDFTFPRRYVRIGADWRQALDFDAPSQDKLSQGLQLQGASLENAPVEQ